MTGNDIDNAQPSAEITRRDFVLGSVLTLASANLGGCQESKEPPFTTEQIATERKRMMAFVKKELVKARDSGKQPVILIGENHENRNSLLNTLLLISVCSIHGIKTILHEKTQEEMQQMQRDADKYVGEFDRSFGATFGEDGTRLIAATMYAQNYNAESRAITITPKGNDLVLGNSFFAMLFAGGTNAAVDLNRPENVKSSEELLFGRAREDAITEAVAKEGVSGSGLAILGAAHLLGVKRDLEARGMHAIAFDFTNGITAAQLGKLAPISKARLTELEAARKAGATYQSTLVHLKRQSPPGEVMATAVKSHIIGAAPQHMRVLQAIDGIGKQGARR
jgi:hypothetical protein